jgi:predicted  nucleic acid-binding Zn-ribbon protein
MLNRLTQGLKPKIQGPIESKRRGSSSFERLSKEAVNLEQRIRNLRDKLASLEQQLAAKSQKQLPDLSRSIHLNDAGNSKSDEILLDTGIGSGWEGKELGLHLQEYLQLLDSLANCLADERLRLLHQVEQLTEAHVHWEKKHTAGVKDLEARFRQLREVERECENRTIQLRKQQAESHQTRQSLDTWQAKLTVQAANWKGERDRLLAQIHSLEERAGRLIEIIGDLPSDWKKQLEQANSEIIQKYGSAKPEADYANLRQEIISLQGQQAAYEVQVAELNAEIEHLAALLLAENDSIPMPSAKAA